MHTHAHAHAHVHKCTYTYQNLQPDFFQHFAKSAKNYKGNPHFIYSC